MVLNADTCFDIGDFYVTPVIVTDVRFHSRHVRHTDFDGDELPLPPSPAFPIAFFVHERRHGPSYEDFITELLRFAPWLNRKSQHLLQIIFMSDRDDALQNAVRLLTNWLILCCWNHMRRNVRRKV